MRLGPKVRCNGQWLGHVLFRDNAAMSVDTVARFERGDELKERTVEAIRFALEAGGIEFIDDNGGGPGVRVNEC